MDIENFINNHSFSIGDFDSYGYHYADVDAEWIVIILPDLRVTKTREIRGIRFISEESVSEFIDQANKIQLDIIVLSQARDEHSWLRVYPKGE